MMPTALRFATVAALCSLAACGGRDRRGDDFDDGTTSVGGTTSGGGGDEYQLCVDLINDYRASVGRPPLARWTAAESCSDGEAQSDSETGEAHGAFGTCGEFAQDECPGWPGDRASVITGCLEMMWDEGPGGGHYDNMSSESYTMVACGYFDAASGVWAVQNFK